MPGIVQQATATTVLPYALASVFVESRSWPIREEPLYMDGSSNKASQAEESRRDWRLQRPLTPQQWQPLTAFWEARRGSHEPFYFYPVQSQHDPTGFSAAGRYLVRFGNQMAITNRVGLKPAEFSLIEVR